SACSRRYAAPWSCTIVSETAPRVALRMAMCSRARLAGGQGVTLRARSCWQRAIAAASGVAVLADGARFAIADAEPHATTTRHADSSVISRSATIDTASSPGLVAAAF